MPQKIPNKFKLRNLKFNYVTDIDSKHPNFQVRLSTFLYLTQFMRNSCKKNVRRDFNESLQKGF